MVMTIKKRKSIPLSLTLGKVESESRLSVLFLGKEQLESSSQIQITESEIESMLSLAKSPNLKRELSLRSSSRKKRNAAPAKSSRLWGLNAM